MIEFILVGGLMFVLGMIVGRHIGRDEGRRALMQYMMTINTMHNITHIIHLKHGIVQEVEDKLREHGIEIKRIRIGE